MSIANTISICVALFFADVSYVNRLKFGNYNNTHEYIVTAWLASQSDTLQNISI